MPKIKVNDINLYYETHGKGQPLICIAGFCSNYTAWQHTAMEYAKHYQTIIFDNRGVGQTDCPDYLYTIEMMASDVAALIQKLNLGKVHLVGGSMGGCITQTIAYQYPELIKSAIISNSMAKIGIRAKLYAQTILELLKAQIPINTLTKLNSLFTWSQEYLNLPNMLDSLLQQGLTPVTIKGYENQLNAIATFDSTKWLNKIKAPSLVIACDDDLWTTVQEAKIIASAIPNAEYFCFKNIGHVPRIEKPQEFNKLTLDFIAKHD